MKHKLQEEEEKTTKLTANVKQIDSLRRQIEQLREQLIESESEKQSLKTQQERFALLLKESVHQGDRIQKLKDKNQLLESQLEEARGNEAAISHSKNELVDKIMRIQDENDRISIELEGLRSLLVQDKDNEYRLKKERELQRTEPKSHLQDVGLAEKNRKTGREETGKGQRKKEIVENRVRNANAWYYLY